MQYYSVLLIATAPSTKDLDFPIQHRSDVTLHPGVILAKTRKSSAVGFSCRDHQRATRTESWRGVVGSAGTIKRARETETEREREREGGGRAGKRRVEREKQCGVRTSCVYHEDTRDPPRGRAAHAG